MGQPIEAVYEKGAFRPLSSEHLRLAEGQRVRLIVEESLKEDENPLSFAEGLRRSLGSRD